MSTATLPYPNACRHCDVVKPEHYVRWRLGLGFHQWEEPSDAMRKQRLLARREKKKAADVLTDESPRPVLLVRWLD